MDEFGDRSSLQDLFTFLGSKVPSDKVAIVSPLRFSLSFTLLAFLQGGRELRLRVLATVISVVFGHRGARYSPTIFDLRALFIILTDGTRPNIGVLVAEVVILAPTCLYQGES